MRPPYELTTAIVKSIASISQQIGEVNIRQMVRPNPALRKHNRIQTIHSSLKIEGNTLSEDQITAILEDKRVLGPKKDVQEVVNAIGVYSDLQRFRFASEQDFLLAHGSMMSGLVEKPGRYRTKGVGIAKGSDIRHMAPPADRVPFLMANLFKYLRKDPESALIKACVFHYELEFIHPFMDGNGRMGRLWQTVILMQVHPLFEFLPVETLIRENQKVYYQVLSRSDKEGKSTSFIEFMLTVIDRSLSGLLEQRLRRPSARERLESFLDRFTAEFTRKDYMMQFKDISTATASRDLKQGIDEKLIRKRGDKKNTIYWRLKRNV